MGPIIKAARTIVRDDLNQRTMNNGIHCSLFIVHYFGMIHHGRHSAPVIIISIVVWIVSSVIRAQQDAASLPHAVTSAIEGKPGRRTPRPEKPRRPTSTGFFRRSINCARRTRTQISLCLKLGQHRLPDRKGRSNRRERGSNLLGDSLQDRKRSASERNPFGRLPLLRLRWLFRLSKRKSRYSSQISNRNARTCNRRQAVNPSVTPDRPVRLRRQRRWRLRCSCCRRYSKVIKGWRSPC